MLQVRPGPVGQWDGGGDSQAGAHLRSQGLGRVTVGVGKGSDDNDAYPPVTGGKNAISSP